MKNIKFKKLLSYFFIFIFSFILLVPLIKAGSTFIIPKLGENREVLYDKGNYSPQISEYPFNQTGVNKISFIDLYGIPSLLRYNGEVPLETHKLEGEINGIPYTEFRYYNGNKIDGYMRHFSNLKLDESSKDEYTILNPESNDPRIKAMTNYNQTDWFAKALLSIFGFGHSVSKWVLDLVIEVNSWDFADIVNLVDKDGNIFKMITKLFLYDADTKQLSPFLLFSLIGFIITLTVMTLKWFKGDSNRKPLYVEIGYLVLAMVLTGLTLTSTNANKVSNIGMNFIRAFTTEILTNSNDTLSLYSYDTDNKNIDSKQTQLSMLNKPYVDNILKAQLGFSTSQLDLDDGDLGTPEEINRAIKKVWIRGDLDSLGVRNHEKEQNTVYNFAYAFAAMNSQVAKSDDYKSPFYKNGDNIVVNYESNDRTLLAIDFLSELKRIHLENGNSQMVNKIDSIMQNISSPNYFSAMTSIMVLSIEFIFLIISLLLITIFSVIGQIIVVFGSYLIPLGVVLLLFKNTRSFANQFIYTYINGYLRYIIGSVLFNILIVTAIALSEIGIAGMIISMFISYSFTRFGPRILTELNRNLNSNKMLPVVRDANNYLARSYSGKQSAIINSVKSNRKNKKLDKINYQNNINKKILSSASSYIEAYETANPNAEMLDYSIMNEEQKIKYAEDLGWNKSTRENELYNLEKDSQLNKLIVDNEESENLEYINGLVTAKAKAYIAKYTDLHPDLDIDLEGKSNIEIAKELGWDEEIAKDEIKFDRIDEQLLNLSNQENLENQERGSFIINEDLDYLDNEEGLDNVIVEDIKEENNLDKINVINEEAQNNEELINNVDSFNDYSDNNKEIENIETVDILNEDEYYEEISNNDTFKSNNKSEESIKSNNFNNEISKENKEIKENINKDEDKIFTEFNNLNSKENIKINRENFNEIISEKEIIKDNIKINHQGFNEDRSSKNLKIDKNIINTNNIDNLEQMQIDQEISSQAFEELKVINESDENKE